jgi:hypothetical protein
LIHVNYSSEKKYDILATRINFNHGDVMKLKIMATLLCLSLSQLSFSVPPPKPAACPSMSALKAVGINLVLKKYGVWYGGVKNANYATKENWTFVIGEFLAKNQDEARSKIIASLNSMTLFEGGPQPFIIQGKDSWLCAYRDQSGHFASAVTPIEDLDTDLLK